MVVIVGAPPTCGLGLTSPCGLTQSAWIGRAIWACQQAGSLGCNVARTGLGQVGPSVWLSAGRLGEDGSVRCLIKIAVKVTHTPCTSPHHTHITRCLADRLTSHKPHTHYSPNSFPRLWDWRIGPTWVRSQRWGGYIGPADAFSP